VAASRAPGHRLMRRFDPATSMAHSDARAHNSSVGTSRTVAACVATFVLAGCSGGGHPTGATSWSPPPGFPGPFKSYRPLLAAVTTWFDLVGDGDARQAYRHLVSDRCRRYETLAQFQRSFQGLDPLAQGIQIRAHRTHEARHGAVQFVSPDTPFTPTAWFWIRDHGEWKEDGCPPSE
jgi:hypothetical protein